MAAAVLIFMLGFTSFAAGMIWCLLGPARELPSGWWVLPGLMAGTGMILSGLMVLA